MSKPIYFLTVIALLFSGIQCGDHKSEQKSAPPDISAGKAETTRADTLLAIRDSTPPMDRKFVEENYDRIVIARAPDFSLFDLSGNKTTLSDYKGYVVLLHFWSMDSPECRELIPILSRLYNKYNLSRFVVLAISTDQTTAGIMQEYADLNRIPYPILLSYDRNVYQAYRVNMPSISFLIDRKGNIVGQFTGQLAEERIEQVINLFL